MLPKSAPAAHDNSCCSSSKDEEEPCAAPLLPPSSRLPQVTHYVIVGVVAAACCVLSVGFAFFVCLCLLLSYTNMPEVHQACFGLWDLMVVSMLVPFMIPAIYCMLASCAWWLSWRAFYGATAAVMGVACLHMAIVAGETPACVDALRSCTPPLPWLLYVAFLKSALFLASAASACALGDGHHPPSQPRI